MSEHSSNQGKGRLVWRLMVLAIVIFFLAAGIYFLIASTRESKRLEQAVIDRFGWAEQYTPVADGSIPPRRVEGFIRVRQAVQPNCVAFQRILDGIIGLEAIETDTELSGEEKASRGIGGFRSMIKVGPKMLEFMDARNSSLLTEEMGLGEYMYIYLAAYGGQLALEPESPYAGMEESSISPRTREEYIQILRNQLKAVETAGPEMTSSELSADLLEEIEALENGSHLSPWPSGPAGMTPESLGPYREQLSELYCVGIVAIELLQKNRGLGFKG